MHGRLRRLAAQAQQQLLQQQAEADEFDRGSARSVRSTSTVSTVATTASLASRLAVLNIDFAAEKQELHVGAYEPSILEGSERGESTFTGDEGTESATEQAGEAEPDPGLGDPPPTSLMGVPHVGHEPGSPHNHYRAGPPLQVCSRIFHHKLGGPLQLKRLTAQHCEELKSHGFTVVDGLISREVAGQVKAALLALHRRGRLEEGARAAAAAGVAPDLCYPERVPRGDHVLWLTVGRPPADSWPLSGVLVALQEVYEDLSQVARLRRSGGEYQVSVQPAGASGLGRHRDAHPEAGPLPGGPQPPILLPSGGSGDAPSAAPPQPQQQPQQHQHTLRHHALAAGSGGSSNSGAGGSSSNGWGAPPPVGPRRITCMVFCNQDWERDQGGQLRLWPPRRGGGGGPTSSVGPGPGGSSGHRLLNRRSLTGSDAGASQLSEDKSDTFSLRSHYLGGVGATSLTSSMWAELGGGEAETASVDGSLVLDMPGDKEERLGLEWAEVDGEVVLDLAPLPGRLLIMLAGAVEHATAPATADMATVSAWF